MSEKENTRLQYRLGRKGMEIYIFNSELESTAS